MCTTMEDYEEAFTIFSEKEMSYMPQPNYSDNLTTNNLVTARFRSIQWFIKVSNQVKLDYHDYLFYAFYIVYH